jgi:hypothetical protein
LGLIRLLWADYHLRYFGFPFLLCAFSSIMFQSNLNPGDLFKKIIVEFRGLAGERTKFVREGMGDALRMTGEAVKSGAKMAKGALT